MASVSSQVGTKDESMIFLMDPTFLPRIRNMGYLPENAPVYPDMSLIGFLDFIMERDALPRFLISGSKTRQWLHHSALFGEKERDIP